MRRALLLAAVFVVAAALLGWRFKQAPPKKGEESKVSAPKPGTVAGDVEDSKVTQ